MFMQNKNEKKKVVIYALAGRKNVRKAKNACVCLFVCLLINYNVAFDRINVMATINVRQRINVPETGHV